MMVIRAVVVEEELLTRRYLADLLTSTGRVEIVGEAEDARAGLPLCQRSEVDAAFLDICLPGPDGLSLGKALTRLPRPPLLIFVSGSAGYAVDAFQMHAVDYLLKPIDRKRVEEAVRHLEQRLSEQHAARGALNGDWRSASPQGAVRLPVHDRRRDVARLLARHEIVGIVRRGRRTWIHTVDAEYPSYYPVARLADWLGGAPFLRAAREAIVNLESVAEIIHYGERLYQLRLKDRRGTVITASRSGARSLAFLLKPRL